MNIREFEEKYDQYKTVIYRIAFTYLKNNEECEDAMQEVFLKYLLSAPAFESTEHEKRWLIRVTVNYCKNNLKLFWNSRRGASEEIAQLPADNEEKAILEEIFNLPEKFKIVIYLYYVEGYKCAEIAEILGMKESAVKMRLKKGRELLKIQWEKGEVFA